MSGFRKRNGYFHSLRSLMQLRCGEGVGDEPDMKAQGCSP